MKKPILFILILLSVLCSQAFAANVKITELTEDTAPTTDDLTITVNSPSGTATNKKVTLANLTKGLNVSNVTTGTLTIANGGTGASSLNDLITLGTHTTGGYAASVSEGGAATTATALAANGSNCSAGSFPLGVDASGASESCTDVWTEAENTAAAYAAQATTMTVAGTSLDISSSAGAQSLAANRTWTLSFDRSSTLAGNPALSANYASLASTGIIFEGSTADTIEGLLTAADPTASDKTWTLPNETGTICTTGSVCSGYQASGSYLTSETDPVVKAINGIVKSNGSAISAAVSATDYAPATSGSAILKGNGAGGFSSASSGTDYAPATSGSSILKGNGLGGFSNASSGTDYEVPLTFSTGLTRSTNTVTVNTSQNISTLSNLTSNGFVKTSGGTGLLSIDSSTYLTSASIDTSAELAAILGDETGSGSLVFGTSPTIATPTLTLSTSTSTSEGRIAWDGTNDYLIMGDGSATRTFVPTGTLTDTKVCTWDATNRKIVCNTTGGGTDTNAEKEYWWPASALLPLEAGADSIPPISKITGTNVDVLAVSFDDSTDECRTAHFKVPSDVNASGTSATFRIVWFSQTATTGNVIWDARYQSTGASGESFDQTLTTKAASASAVAGTTKQRTVTTWTETFTNLGWAANDDIEIAFCRDANNASDTMTGDAEVIGVGVEMPRA